MGTVDTRKWRRSSTRAPQCRRRRMGGTRVGLCQLRPQREQFTGTIYNFTILQFLTENRNRLFHFKGNCSELIGKMPAWKELRNRAIYGNLRKLGWTVIDKGLHARRSPGRCDAMMISIRILPTVGIFVFVEPVRVSRKCRSPWSGSRSVQAWHGQGIRLHARQRGC